MAFYKSKYTGTEIDQRLTQGTYDDAVKAGFTGSKEEFDKIIVAFDENAQQKLDAAQPKIDHRLETLNKSIVDAINELHDEVNQKQDVGDYVDKEEFEGFKDEVAAIYATKNEVEESTDKINSDISTLNNNLVKSINSINENLNNSLVVINESTKQLSETLVAEIDQRKDADDEINSKLANLESKNILPGAGISIIEESPNKIINLAEDTLTKIQYSDSEVRRLEKDKIPYAYDEKTQSNINVILPEGGSYLGNYGDENATVAKAAVYDGTKQLELGSSKVHTNINTDSDVTIETSTGKKTIATTDELVNVVNIPIRSLQDKVYTQEEIFDWFGVTSVPELKQKISRGSQMYLRYGISLSGNPMYYKMPIEYTAFESANQIKLVFVGLNTRDDVASKYEMIMNLDGTVIERNSNIKVTITSIEPEDIDLSEYATKEELNDYALKSELPDVSDFVTKEEVPNVFETKGLTELETGESSANIEAALGIDFISLIEIIRENKTIIVDRNSAGDYKSCIHATGNISGGNGAANLMFMIGTVPTIYQIQYVNETFALAVDEYPFAKKSDISNLATKEEITSKVDWVDYNNTKNIVLPSNGQVFGDFGGSESNSSLLGARIYNAGLDNEEKQVEVGTSKVHLNLNSSDKPTIETPDGKEALVVESDIELIPIEVNFPIRTSGGSDGPEDRVYTQEEILEWFGVSDIAALKKQIANKGIQYIKYGIMLMGNPYYYRMPVQYAAFESANQIKLVFIGLNTNNDVVSKYEILINLDGTIIEGNSNIKVTITSIEPENIDLSKYITKDEFNTMKTSLESQINNLNTTISQLQSLIEDINTN